MLWENWMCVNLFSLKRDICIAKMAQIVHFLFLNSLEHQRCLFLQFTFIENFRYVASEQPAHDPFWGWKGGYLLFLIT